MLTQIGVEFEGDELIIPILSVTTKDSLLIRKITGLNPPDLDLFIGDYSRDGGIFQGRRVGNRNIVMTFDLNPNPALGETISGLREILYKTFVDPLVDADYVKMNFYDDLGRTRYAVGYTEKFETEIFDVETGAQISMICPDPYLRDDTEVVMAHDPGWITVPPFTYGGTAETGFSVEIELTSSTSTVTLDNNGKTMVIERAFSSGDIIRISTVRGSRSMTVQSGGPEQSIVAHLSPFSNWLELHSQRNTMKVYGATTADIVAGVTELRYTPAYWGV